MLIKSCKNLNFQFPGGRMVSKSCSGSWPPPGMRSSSRNKLRAGCVCQRRCGKSWRRRPIWARRRRQCWSRRPSWASGGRSCTGWRQSSRWSTCTWPSGPASAPATRSSRAASLTSPPCSPSPCSHSCWRSSQRLLRLCAVSGTTYNFMRMRLLYTFIDEYSYPPNTVTHAIFAESTWALQTKVGTVQLRELK